MNHHDAESSQRLLLDILDSRARKSIGILSREAANLEKSPLADERAEGTALREFVTSKGG